MTDPRGAMDIINNHFSLSLTKCVCCTRDVRYCGCQGNLCTHCFLCEIHCAASDKLERISGTGVER